MYRQKRVQAENPSFDREFDILERMLTPDELDVIRLFKEQENKWRDDF